MGGQMTEVGYCPFCGNDEIKLVGKRKGGDEMTVYRCDNCEKYFAVEELEPPFEVVVEK